MGAREGRNAAPQPSDPLSASANEPLALLHFAFRAIVPQPDAKLKELGLGRVHGPLRELVRQGLVESVALPGNSRERRLSLSSSGSALERRLSGHQRRAFTSAFQRVGASAARGWRTVMLELIDHAERK